MAFLSKLFIVGLVAALGSACTSDDTKMEEAVQVDPNSADKSDLEKFTVDKKTGEVDFQAKIVYFNFDEAILSAEARTQLGALAEYLMKTGKKVRIEGHADNRGSVEYNLALGERRAQAVKKFLNETGVDAGKLSVVSLGEEKPASEGDAEEHWSKNRRAEFVVE